ncbi:MAG: hypothetical protein J0I47_12180 [Sphingomonas sp.]|uniref:hypothetical protein n=1 Tax=Sphingomonas sp. TaxID=28214 RepID=UPI001AC58839|nr:hypothetical protein [Sphingomonas sp.]MBN8808973.1 hypothetical protein [Sphingomonas sp.]
MTLPAFLSPVARLPRWSQLLLVAIVLRAITFGDPIVHVDESFYFTTARAMVDGALPYVDVWDRKPVGLFLLYLPAAALGVPLGIWVYQAMALAAATATAAMVARLADRAGWRRGALVAGIAYLAWLDMLEGQGGQAPVFYNLLMIAAAALIAPGERDEAASARLGRGVGAMALVGVALQIKYSVVFEGLFFGLWWMWRERRLGNPVVRIFAGAALLAIVALLPTALAYGYYAWIGQAPAFVYANFRSIGQRQADPLLEQLGNLGEIVLITSPLFAAAILSFRRGERTALRTWLFAWLGAATFGVLIFGTWFDHYALPLIAPLCICGAGFADDPRRARLTVPIALGLALVVGLTTTVRKWATRGTATEFARIADAVGRGPGCLYVYSGDGDVMLYPYTGRCHPSRYVFPSHLGRTRERGAIGVDQQAEIDRILDGKPAIVVMRTPYSGERSDLRALVIERMARDYRLSEQLPQGSDSISVFTLKRPSPMPAADDGGSPPP